MFSYAVTSPIKEKLDVQSLFRRLTTLDDLVQYPMPDEEKGTVHHDTMLSGNVLQ